jgi:hypothetical protein
VGSGAPEGQSDNPVGVPAQRRQRPALATVGATPAGKAADPQRVEPAWGWQRDSASQRMGTLYGARLGASLPAAIVRRGRLKGQSSSLQLLRTGKIRRCLTFTCACATLHRVTGTCDHGRQERRRKRQRCP